MREIKFRAWDTVGKQWLWITGFETAETSVSDGYTLDGLFHDGDYVGKEGIVLMQYTGLKDKNGKEIYEKDVCKLDNFTGVVVFSDGCFRISDGRRTAYFISTDCREVEVIGNVFENGELLNDCEEA